MEDAGFEHFSALEFAKRIDYSIGTISKTFGSYDAFILAINGRTPALWRDQLARRLGQVQQDRLRAAITPYFDYATTHHHSWASICDFRLPEDVTLPERYQAKGAPFSISQLSR